MNKYFSINKALHYVGFYLFGLKMRIRPKPKFHDIIQKINYTTFKNAYP